MLEAVPGDPAAKPQDVLYSLPFEDAPVREDQGVGGRFSHQDAHPLRMAGALGELRLPRSEDATDATQPVPGGAAL
ncbi:hypothetical protein K8O61_06125 [Xanthomonas cerealis pv. cerealis]|uniref:hypothetical protein n=1 Tax=Xanthomonas cerealis TaxID=3390025 RepID=UPI001F41218F|nr:hypothetical protein [Xanthomonas translucens]UKE70610.1 hypothetical protein K8O61_06125 [Xanthomonas translucens pv. pistacia]